MLLLETGKVAYYGPVSSLRGSLTNLGFPCPEGTPLPELLLDVLELPSENVDSHKAKLEKLKELSDTSKHPDHGSPTKSAAGRHRASCPVTKEAPVKRAGFVGQLGTLFRREVTNVRRNKALTLVRASLGSVG